MAVTRKTSLPIGALAFVALAAAALAGACDSNPIEPPPATKVSSPPQRPAAAAQTASPQPATAAPPAAAAGSLKWTKPEGWQAVDHPSTMRKGTFKIPKVEGDSEDAEMSITQVGGGVAANIKRWEGQFVESAPAKVTEKTVNGLTVTIVEKTGAFQGMMMPGSPAGAEANKEWALLGAVVHTEPAHYFKMTGPMKTVQSSRADFDKLVESFAPAP